MMNETLDNLDVFESLTSIDEMLEVLFASAKNGIAPIVQAGHPVLRQWCPPYEFNISDKKILKLIEIMRNTMEHAPGVGLAAPQIGLNLNLAVVQDNSELDDDEREFSPLEFTTIINPSYTKIGFATKTFYEGCLSFNGYSAMRRRFQEIYLTYQTLDKQNLKKQFRGWPARIMQHETDHLAGELYIDNAEIVSLIDNKYF